jgi:uncharacterized protein (TIGR02265 family)
VSSLSVDMGTVARALDLDERLRRTPSTAKVRGVFFQLIDAQLRRRGLASASEWRLAAGKATRHVHVLYPATDLLRAMAIAGALMNPDPRQGVREIFSDGARFAAATWFGRTFRTVFSPDPLSALRWLERSHDYICNYGRWRVEERGPGRATLHMYDEYFWIDCLHLGGCEGLLEACGVVGTVHASLDTLFTGRLEVAWRLPN